MTTIIKSKATKASISEILGSLIVPGRFHAFKYCGAFKLQKSPMEIQRSLRDEWE
jgi:hypothetical protein